MTEVEAVYSDDTDCSDSSENGEVGKEIQRQIRKAIEDGLLNDEMKKNRFFKKQLRKNKNEEGDVVSNESELTKPKPRKLDFFKKRKLKDSPEKGGAEENGVKKEGDDLSEIILPGEEIEENKFLYSSNSNEEEKFIIKDLESDALLVKGEEPEDAITIVDSDSTGRSDCKKSLVLVGEKEKEKEKKCAKKEEKKKKERERQRKSHKNSKKGHIREKKRKSNNNNAEEENLKINKVQLLFESDNTDDTDDLSMSSLSDVELLNKDDKKEKGHFNFLTWNTDGLCDILVKTRMLKIIDIIKKTKVSIVFLQEVINDTIELIKLYLSDDYEIIEAEDSCGKKLTYFCLTLILKKHFKVIEKETFWFYGTVMGRHAIKILVHPVNKPDQKILLINTHLESSSSFKQERICQLKQCIIDMLENQKKEINTIIFGGDLNVRDDEIKSIELPSNILDVWEYLGSPKNCQYTWNCLMNRNFCKNFFFFKPRCRFDRVYWIKNNADNYAKPINIKKVGNTRVSKQHHMLPSDHYGLIIKFNIV